MSVSGVTLDKHWAPTGMTAVILQGSHTPQLHGQHPQPTQTSMHSACLKLLILHIPQPQGSKTQGLWKGHTSASLFCPLHVLVTAHTASSCLHGHSSCEWVQAQEGPQEGIKMGVGLAMPWGAVGRKVSDWCVWGAGVWQGSEVGKDARDQFLFMCVWRRGESQQAPTKLYWYLLLPRTQVDSAQRSAGGVALTWPGCLQREV